MNYNQVILKRISKEKSHFSRSFIWVDIQKVKKEQVVDNFEQTVLRNKLRGGGGGGGGSHLDLQCLPSKV